MSETVIYSQIAELNARWAVSRDENRLLITQAIQKLYEVLDRMEGNYND